jgi:hypothetical protein
VATQHVSYELVMMAALADVRSPPGTEGFLTVGLLESYLLHVRNLNDFLGSPAGIVKRKGWNRTVVAAHYFDHAYPHRYALAKKERDRLNRKLAHITTARRPNTRWDLAGDRAAWADRVLWTFEHRFLSRLRKAHPAREGWFADAMATARVNLEASRNGQVVAARIGHDTHGRLVLLTPQ